MHSLVNINSNFLAKSLPVLVHTQICEAIEKVVGQDYRPNLIEFEKSKNQELGVYAKGAGPRCVKYMHDRLQSYLRWMVEKDSGCIPITWGEDVRHTMPLEEFEHVDMGYEIYCNKRLEALLDHQRDVKEAFKILTKEGPRSDVLIKNKLKKLDGRHAWGLKRMLVEHKIANKMYDEIDMVTKPSVVTAYADSTNIGSGGDDSAPSSPTRGGRRGKGEAASFPAKMYVIQREGLKQYAQLDRKVQQLFDGAYSEFSTFKKRQMKNVQLQTKMTVDICDEIKQFKEVYKDF